MRADRLVATVLLLQSRGRVTAAEVADELEVSVATARRDLEALSAAGVPVFPQAGRGGGWSLVGGARTDLTGFTAGEARSLLLLLGPAAATTPDVRSALRKLIRALPGPFRDDAQAAAAAVVVDSSGWGEAERRRPELVERLQSAVVRRRKVRLTYAARGREASQRLVDPWGLVDKDDVWYLVAGTERGQRTFRVDRMTEVEETDLLAERPDDFELSAAWEEVVETVERQRSLVSAIVTIPSGLVRVLRMQFGRHCVVLSTQDGGRTRVQVSAHMALSIAERLAGWGATVEVEEPESVRTELARIGSELLARYAGSG